MTYKPNRQESEEGGRILAERYPKCFFENPRQRRPLKKGIINDLIKDGAPIAPELITAIVDWYKLHLGYQKKILAGEKRINLDGDEAGIVTEAEQRAAEKKVEAAEAKMKREREAATSAAASLPPVRFGTAFPDFMKSMRESAPAMTSKPPTITPAPAAPVINPEPKPVNEAMLSANAAISLPVPNAEMRKAIIQAVMVIVIKEARGGNRQMR
jgi:sRNA-binding protein